MSPKRSIVHSTDTFLYSEPISFVSKFASVGWFRRIERSHNKPPWTPKSRDPQINDWSLTNPIDACYLRTWTLRLMLPAYHTSYRALSVALCHTSNYRYKSCGCIVGPVELAICSRALGDGCSRLKGEVEDKEGFCEACGNNRIIFELALEEIRNEWLIHDPLPSYRQVKFELLFGRSNSFDGSPSYEQVRSGSRAKAAAWVEGLAHILDTAVVIGGGSVPSLMHLPCAWWLMCVGLLESNVCCMRR